MSKQPWLKFDAEAWLSDPHLRMCSPAAQGLLINLMAIAHGANPYGYLVNGTLAINDQNIGKIMAWNRQTVGKAWAELVLHGRTVEAECGLWYIPRMVKDHAESAKHSANGAKGGNPSLIGVNPPLKAPLKAEKRERREEKKREDTPKPKKKMTDKQKAERIYEEYPKKVGRGKAVASIVKALKNGADPNIVINAVIAYDRATKSWPAEDRQYIPNPATWFNQERWTDDQSEWTKGTKQAANGSDYVVQTTQEDG